MPCGPDSDHWPLAVSESKLVSVAPGPTEPAPASASVTGQPAAAAMRLPVFGPGPTVTTGP